MSRSSPRTDRGDADAAPDELLGFVAGTPLRCRVLEVLATEDLEVREITGRLDAPRTTVRHNLGKLEEAGLVVESRHQEYSATTLGLGVFRGLQAYREEVAVVAELEPFFECVSPVTFDGDLRRLAGAELTVSDRADPYAPAQRLVDRLGAADSVTGMMAAMPPLSDPEIHDHLAYTRTRFVISPGVASILADEFEPAVANAVELDGFDVRVKPVDAPFGVVVVDDAVVLWATDENDKPHALVETDDPEFRAWAIERIEDHLADAEPIGEFLDRD